MRTEWKKTSCSKKIGWDTTRAMFKITRAMFWIIPHSNLATNLFNLYLMDFCIHVCRCMYSKYIQTHINQCKYNIYIITYINKYTLYSLYKNMNVIIYIIYISIYIHTIHVYKYECIYIFTMHTYDILYALSTIHYILHSIYYNTIYCKLYILY